jgi:hypothetical protein
MSKTTNDTLDAIHATRRKIEERRNGMTFEQNKAYLDDLCKRVLPNATIVAPMSTGKGYYAHETASPVG